MLSIKLLIFEVSTALFFFCNFLLVMHYKYSLKPILKAAFEVKHKDKMSKVPFENHKNKSSGLDFFHKMNNSSQVKSKVKILFKNDKEVIKNSIIENEEYVKDSKRSSLHKIKLYRPQTVATSWFHCSELLNKTSQRNNKFKITTLSASATEIKPTMFPIKFKKNSCYSLDSGSFLKSKDSLFKQGDNHLLPTDKSTKSVINKIKTRLNKKTFQSMNNSHTVEFEDNESSISKATGDGKMCDLDKVLNFCQKITINCKYQIAKPQEHNKVLYKAQNKFSDPLVKAPDLFLKRLKHIESLELKTVLFEKLKQKNKSKKY